LASGRNAQAEAIVEKARHLGIPVHADAPLAKTLSAVPVGAVIPEELYPVVAQVLALIYAMDGRLAAKTGLG
jgi:flagellar biosynthesis protein